MVTGRSCGRCGTPPVLGEGLGGRAVTYVVDVMVLDRRPVIRIRSVAAGGTFRVGYFASV